MVSENGDRSDWFAAPRAVASEAVVGNGLEPAAKGPFSFPFAPVPDRTYLDQRRLFRGARRGMAQGLIDEARPRLFQPLALLTSLRPELSADAIRLPADPGRLRRPGPGACGHGQMS